MVHNKKVRIGILGAGKMALWHLRAYSKNPSVYVAAISNPLSCRGKRLARKFSIPAHYSNGEEMIEKENLHCLDISIPTGLHAEFIKLALANDLHIYCEKPLCTSTKEALPIIDANREKKRVIFNGFNYRFFPEIIKIKSIISSGTTGDIRYVRMLRVTKEPPNSYMLGPKGSNIFYEMHSHFIDLLSFFGMGSPSKVYAAGTSVHDWALNPDTATITLTYPDGAVAEITASYASPGIAPEILIVGRKKTIRLRYGSVSSTKKKDEWTIPGLLWLMCKDSVTIPLNILKNPFALSCSHFISCIEKNIKSDCDELSALYTLQILEAAKQSFCKGLPVPFKRCIY